MVVTSTQDECTGLREEEHVENYVSVEDPLYGNPVSALNLQ